MKKYTRILAFLWVCTVLSGLFVPIPAAATEQAHVIDLSFTENGGEYTHQATLDGQPVAEYDYTWHADPTADHQQVKNSPAEFYTGTAPTGEDPVYIAHDIYYYPLLDESKFQQVNYDGEMEWAYFYEAPGYETYIFSTLPVLKTGFPSQMMHSAQEAYQNAVLHITQPGQYVLQGQWHGQIRVDLGEDAFEDESQTVTLILNGVDITCTVASGVVFANVYECDNGWENTTSHSHNVDTAAGGAKVVLADGTVNHVSGTNIFRILKTQYKDEADTAAYPAQKKRLKVDGAFYSYQSLNISGQADGTGVLNITAGYEGLNTELHLTINSGHVNIFSQDDGINVNEDGVSVLTVNGGSLHICAGLGAEGDGVDSNGYLVINGGTVISVANPASDSGLDSDFGSFVNGGTVLALGSTMDWAEADQGVNSSQAVLNLRFQASQSDSDVLIITDSQDRVVFAYDPAMDEVAGSNRRGYTGAIVSAPGLQVGGTYRLYVGGKVSGSEYAGMYDPATVTGFTGAVRQCYGGDAMTNMGGGFRPNDRNPGNMGGDFPPEGMQPGQQPQRPDGGQPGDFGQPQQNGATCGYESDFVLSQTVNAFTSVTALRHDLQQQGQYYVCTACGNTYQDPEGSVLLATGTKAPAWQGVIWPCAISFLLGAAAASAVFAIVLGVRRKKK